jgi:hypothetical protein
MSTSGAADPRYEEWLEAIERDGANLTSWEEEFVESIRDRFDRGWDTLTERQAEILERIYSDRTA